MPQDIVDLDTQNKLTVPAGELTPFPLTQNDKPVDASKIEVPTQEPVAIDNTTPVALGLDAINQEMDSAAYKYQKEQENKQEAGEQEPEPVLNEQKQPQEGQEVYTREETTEEQYKRIVGEFDKANPEYSYYIKETNKVIKTNEKDFEKAKFDYLSFKMRQTYLKNTHNYADYGQNIVTHGNTTAKTLAKSLGGMATDMITATGSMAVTGGVLLTGAVNKTIKDVSDNQNRLFKFAFGLDNRLLPKEETDRSAEIISDNTIAELKAQGADEATFLNYVKGKYSCPVKYQNSKELDASSARFMKAVQQWKEGDFDGTFALAEKAYSDFRNINKKIKDSLDLNMDENDNPTAAYWGSVASSAIICSAGMLSGGMGWLMPVAYGAMEFDEAVQEGMENGKSFEESLLKSYAIAGVSMLTERLQLGSIWKRYPSFKSLRWKGLARWAAENAGQEVIQDLSIMASKEALVLADYTIQEYLMTIPESGLAALVSSVPMGVIVQHRKVGLAKRLHAAGMKEENAIKFADMVMDEGVQALTANPQLMNDYISSFKDVFNTTKVILARNAIEAGNREDVSNKKAVDNANNYAQQRQAVGENVVVFQQSPMALKEELTGYQSTSENFEQFDPMFRGSGEGTAVWGAGAYFLLDKNFNIIKYGGQALKAAGRSGSGYVLTVKLPDTKFLMQADKPLTEQNDYIQAQLKKTLNSLHKQGLIESNYERLKNLSAMDVYDKVANELTRTGAVTTENNAHYSKMSSIFAENGIKGNMYTGQADGAGVVVFDEANDAKILQREELPHNRSLAAQKVRELNKQALDSMTLEEFLDKTKVKDWFDENLAKEILNPDKVIDRMTTVLTNTNLFSPQEAKIAATNFAMVSYVQMALIGHNEVKDFLDTFPQIINSFMYSAFGNQGEYQEVIDRIPEGNILKRRNPTFNNMAVANPELKKKLFGNAIPTESDLTEIAKLVKMILDGKAYQGTKGSETERWYNILKQALTQKVENDPRSPAVGNILLPVINFEARLQKTSSYGNNSDVFISKDIVNSNYGIIDSIKLEEHYMDLAILRVLGLWGSTKNYQSEIEGDGKLFWNKNRNKPELALRYINEDTEQVHTDIAAIYNYWNQQKGLPKMGKKSFADMVKKGTAVSVFDDLMLTNKAMGILDPTGNVDILGIATRSRGNTPVHEFGHEIFMIVTRTLQDLSVYQPQKTKRIYDAMAKVYEAKYKEKLTGSLTDLQYKRLHELFAELYAKSLNEGLAVKDGSKDLNDLLKMASVINRIIRNPSVPISFIKEDGGITFDNQYDQELWENVWNELNRKEDYVNLLKARNTLIDGIKTQKNPTQLYYEIESLILEMPNTNTKLQLASVLKKLGNKVDPLDALNLNNILVKAAVQDMFGVQLVNQNLIDQFDTDPTIKAAANMGKFFAISKGAFRRYVPEKLQNFLSNAYIHGIKTWDKVVKDIDEMVKDDGYVKSAINFIRKTMQPLSTTAKKLNKVFYSKLEYAIFSENKLKTALNTTYTKVYDVYAKMSDADKLAFDNALMDQNWNDAGNIYESNNGDRQVVMDLKKDLEAMYSLYEEMDPNGEGIGMIQNFFPRAIADLDGMIDYMSKTDKYKDMAQEMAETRDMNEAISTYVLSKYGKGYNPQISQAGNTKKRMFDVVPDDLRQFYKKPLEALQKYYDDIATSYGRYVFFGKAANMKLQNDSFEETAKLLLGDDVKEVHIKVYTPTKNWEPALKALGFLKEGDTEYNKKLMEVLEGTFYRGNPHPGLTIFRTVNNIATINNLFTAMSNLVDFAITTYRYGFTNTVFGARDVFNKNNIVEYNELMTDLYKEFDMDSYNLNRWYNRVFKWSGFSMMDIFGKQSSINAAFYNAKQKLSAGNQSIVDKISDYMGGDQDRTSAVISDILNDRASDDVKFFLFNELSGQQPLTLLDVPYYYNRYPYMRIFYQFRTFTLRQFDFFKNEVLIPKLKKDPVGALKDVCGFMALMLAFGIPKEAIKAFLLGQPLDLSDEAVSQILAIGMLNKYSYYEAKKGNILSSMAYATIIPPVPVLTRAYNDAKGLTVGKKVGKRGRKRIDITEVQSIKDLPVGGEFFYWWFGGGSDSQFAIRK